MIRIYLYPSDWQRHRDVVQALARDIEHTSGQPVLVRPGDFTYVKADDDQDASIVHTQVLMTIRDNQETHS